MDIAAHLAAHPHLARIDEVTVEDVREVAAVLLRRPMGAAVVGPYSGPRDLPRSVRSIVE